MAAKPPRYMKAMLLAAGLGTRLRPLTYELPKPMVPILGRPVMEHILRLLARHGFDDVIANLHYFPDLIREPVRRRVATTACGSRTRSSRSCWAPPEACATCATTSATRRSWSSPATRSPTST